MDKASKERERAAIQVTDMKLAVGLVRRDMRELNECKICVDDFFFDLNILCLTGSKKRILNYLEHAGKNIKGYILASEPPPTNADLRRKRTKLPSKVTVFSPDSEGRLTTHDGFFGKDGFMMRALPIVYSEHALARYMYRANVNSVFDVIGETMGSFQAMLAISSNLGMDEEEYIQTSKGMFIISRVLDRRLGSDICLVKTWVAKDQQDYDQYMRMRTVSDVWKKCLGGHATDSVEDLIAGLGDGGEENILKIAQKTTGKKFKNVQEVFEFIERSKHIPAF